MDEHRPDVPRHAPGWVDWAIVIALVIVIGIAAYVLLGPQIANIYTTPNNNML